jgi:hypothetical protein
MWQQDEYCTASGFLGDELTPPKAEGVGLHVPEWRDTTISGNHDNWPLTPTVFGGPPDEKKTTFRRMPFHVFAILKLPGDYTVSFLGTDTDADVHPRGWRRFMAQGAFHSQLKSLDNFQELPISPNDNKDIRVLLLHHSRAYVSRYGELRMTRKSKQS